MKVRSAIQTGRQALLLSKSQWEKPQRNWVGKTVFGSCTLTESYCLAAMNAPFSTHRWEDNMEAIMGSYTTNILGLCRVFSNLPEYCIDPQWMILASVIEGFSYYSQLKEIKSEVFPHQKLARDIYLEYVPCTWTIIKNRLGLFLDDKLIWDMMLLSALNYQVDEYMESVVGAMTESNMKALQRSIPQLIARMIRTDTGEQGARTTDDIQDQDFGSLQAIQQVLGRYITAILLHKRIREASSADRSSLSAEFQTFLGAQIEQLQDNGGFCRQRTASHVQTMRWNAPRASHYSWAHTTAASHTSCPFSFWFFVCLLGHCSSDPSFPSADVFASAYTRYLAEDVCSHVGVMSRLYNDYGSISRDEAECNINSVNFPEFHGCTDNNISPILDEAHAGKQQTRNATDQLLRLAQYEKKCVDSACAALLESLETTSKRAWKIGDAMRLFVDVAKMYTNLYEAMDITNRVK
ncbi:MAG: hypothetical protein LQ352_001328 [Teloschistes flavicans]|nr:MAG: hypothetical protein LQ352_001328 [Teloschistes flavicans]